MISPCWQLSHVATAIEAAQLARASRSRFLSSAQPIRIMDFHACQPRVYNFHQMIEASMRKRVGFLAVAWILSSGLLVTINAQNRGNLPPRLLTAKFVYFEDQTGFAAVGGDALRELERWGRFQVVRSRDQADLVLVLSSKVESETLAT